ncbi:MAG TPA: recombinase family protein [Candidatus Thermoplasmatota archaeon]|nr:recombinase family protein [Candidatus Thermoplasmatota archaeon]
MKRTRVSDSSVDVSSPNDLRVITEAPARKHLRAAIYARVSSPKQKTVPAQLEICRQRVAERGWKLHIELHDHALKGHDASRPGFQALIDLAESKAIDVVVVWKLDRLARSLVHSVEVEDLFHTHGVAIHSCTEPIDTTTATGRFMFGILANAAQLEREMIGERARMGKYARALKGRWPESQVPFGYKRTKGNHLKIREEEAAVVRAVFETYKREPSYAETSHVLNVEGLKFRGDNWNVRRVRMILENGIYAGHYAMCGVKKEMPHLAIVDPGLFEEIRQLRAKKTRKGQRASNALRDAALDSVFRQYLESLDQLEDTGGQG